MGIFGPPNIEKMKQKKDAKGLNKILEGENDFDMKSDAARALGELGDQTGIRWLVEQLGGLACKSPESTSSSEALVALGHSAAPVLGGLLADPSAGTVKHQDAATVLAAIGGPEVQDALLDVFEKDRVNENTDHRMETARDALMIVADGRIVERLLGHLKEGELSSSEYSRKINTIMILGATRDKRAVDPLITTLGEQERFIVKASATALGNFEDPRVVLALIDALNWMPKDKWVYDNARDALAKIGSPALDSLCEALSSSSEFIRRGAVQALGAIGDDRAVEPLVQLLQRPKESWDAKRIACWALGTIGCKDAVPALQEICKTTEQSLVRKSAEDALKQLGAK